jgi:hypothetical protein
MNEENTAPEVEEVELETEESTESEPKSAEEDLDSALEKALSGDSEPEAEEKPVEEEKEPEPEQQAPAEWSKEEREYFKTLDRRGRDIHLRLQQSRNADYRRRTSEYDKNVNHLKTEYGSLRQMADVVKPFIESAGMNGKDPYKALTEAVAVVKTINTNPREAIAAILKLKGLRPEDLTGPAPASEQLHEHVAPLQAEVNSLKQKIAAGERAQTGAYLGQVYDTVTREQNSAGATRFPDLNDTPQGIDLAQRVGRCIRSQDFQEAVRARNPNANIRDLIVEAYRWNGGRIDDTPTVPTPSRTPQEHVTRARRASASVPGRVGRASSAPRVKAKDLDHALDMAWEDLEL